MNDKERVSEHGLSHAFISCPFDGVTIDYLCRSGINFEVGLSEPQ